MNATSLETHPGTDSSPAPSRPGVFSGVGALLGSFGFIARRSRCWPWAAVPGLVVLALSGALVWLSFDSFGPWVGRWLLPDAETWYAESAHFALRWLSSILAAYVAILIATVAAPSLSAPALEHLVRLQERALNVPEREPQSFWYELSCGLRSQAFAVCASVPLWVVLALLGAFVPVLAPLWLGAQLLLGSLTLAWNLLDYPLTLRGVRVRQRLTLLKRNAAGVFGFGIAFAALFSLPGSAIVLLPVGVVAATQLTWRMVRADALAAAQLGITPAEPMGHPSA